MADASVVKLAQEQLEQLIYTLQPHPAGDLLPNKSWMRQLRRLISLLKRLAQDSPYSFQPEGFEPRPCITLTIVGTKGSGKSTAINAFVSALRGCNTTATKTAEGMEASVGTLATTPYPLHNDLWTGQPQPPAYVYLVDTRGLDASEIPDMKAAREVFCALFTGSMKVGARSLSDTGSALQGDVCLPPPMCVLYNISFAALGSNEPPAHVLGFFSRLVGEHNAGSGNQPVTFVVMVSKTDNADLTVAEEEAAGSGGFHERRLQSAELRKNVKTNAASVCVPEDVFHLVSGLDTVDAFYATNGPDVGEHAVRLVALLRGVVNGIVSGRQALRDFEMRGGVCKSAADAAERAEVLRTLREASPSEVEQLIRLAVKVRKLSGATGAHSSRVEESVEAACNVVQGNLLSGSDLLELSEAEVAALFRGCCVGVRHAILDIVEDAR